MERARDTIILSRNAYDGTPLQVVEINSEELVCKYKGDYYRRDISWERVDKGTYNQDISMYDLPYILLGKDVYPLRTFVLRIPEAEYYYLIFGNDIDYSIFDKD